MVQSFKKRLFLNIAITASILVVLVIFIIFFVFDLKARSQNIFDTVSREADGLKAASDLANLSKQSQESEPIIKRLNDKIPSKDFASINFRPHIDSIAVRNSLVPVSSFVGEKDGDIKTLEFNMNVQGSYSNILKFMNEIDAMPYIFNITNITIIGGDSHSGATINGNLLFK